VQSRIIVDTSVLVAALLRGGAGASRQVLRHCLEGHSQALVGEKLFCEYESLLSRAELFRRCPLSLAQRAEIFAGFLAVCEWIPVHYLWRPNLPDEDDNHILELAVAGGATAIVTHNVRDFQRGELLFPMIKILTPGEFLKQEI
jgi:putative PIN family toxin of toxin-antitoxin system